MVLQDDCTGCVSLRSSRVRLALRRRSYADLAFYELSVALLLKETAASRADPIMENLKFLSPSLCLH